MADGAGLPSGTTTFLFTDVELSTKTVEAIGDEAYADALDTHRQILRDAFKAHDGREVATEGDALFVAFARAGDAVQAAIDGQRLLEGHPLRVRMGMHTGEALVRAADYVGHDVHKAKRISDAGHGGQILLSQTTADLVGSTISLTDLGSYRLKDLGEPQRLFQVSDEKFPALRTLESARHNLPVQVTSFVGRDRELDEVRALVGRTRLLTITGAGGCGKTRLALQLAAELASEIANGVWLVDLAPQTDPASVTQTIADAVRVPQGHTDDLVAMPPIEDRLVSHLRDRSTLVVLDNCEHLIGACADAVTLLLQNCPGVRIVVTTREPLGVAGETSWRLPSLTLPESSHPDAILDAEAARLFVDRAMQALPSFVPSPEDRVAIVDICTRLDGIPLAIELAAARVRVLPCAEIAQRLDDRFRLLTGGSRTAMPRQQTLRATVDWSHDLLSEAQQALLRRLSVFAGGFSLEHAERVCLSADPQADDVLDQLTALVDRSLVLALRSDGKGRYKLLDTVRHYAREKLVDSGEAPEFRRRHMDYFMELAMRGGDELLGRNVRVWMEVLTSELENLRQAFEWGLSEDPAAALRLVGVLQWFFTISGRYTDARRWAESALAAATDADPSARITAMRVAMLAKPDVARTIEALELARSIGDKSEIAALLEWRARGANALGQIDVALECGTEALAVADEIGDGFTAARVLSTLAVLAARNGDTDTQRSHLERALGLLRKAGNLHGEALAEGTLGNIARLTRNWEEAQTHMERQLELAQEVGCRGCLSNSQLMLGWLARGRGDFEAALDFTANTIRISHEDRFEFSLYFALGTVAMVTHDLGDHERAARLLGAAQAIWESVGMNLGTDPSAAEQRRIAQVRDALGAEVFESAFASGKQMHLDDAVEYALETRT